MFRQEHDLADVIGVVHQLTVDRLNNRVLFAANQNLLSQILGSQRLKRIEDALPTLLPVGEYIVLAGLRLNHKLHIAIAIGLLAVGRQKVGPTRKHVAGHVLHDDGNAVCLFIKRDEELVVFELSNSLVRELLVSAQTRD